MLCHAATVVLLARLARTAELAVRADRADTWLMLPAVFGADLMLIASIGLWAHAVAALRRPWAVLALRVLPLLGLCLLLPADVVSHRLTGIPISFSRLRGDEGATVFDLGLLDPVDLVGGTAAIALGLLSIYPALRFGSRLRALRVWAAPKALLVTLLIGFLSTSAQQLLLPRADELATQPAFYLATSLFDGGPIASLTIAETEWQALQRSQSALPTPAGDHRTPAHRPGPIDNVVIFLAEGIAFEHTGFSTEDVLNLKRAVTREAKKKRKTNRQKGGKSAPLERRQYDATPHLHERQQRDGLLFDRFHTNWHASIQAIFSLVCSRFPPPQGDIVRIKPRIDCGELSEVMDARGVKAGLFHGGYFNFYNKLALLGHRRYAVEYDAAELALRSKRRSHQWGIDDRAVVDATLQWVDSLPKGERFAALLIPITAHYPYWTPSDFKRPFAPQGRRRRFLNAVAFQDQVFEELLRGFEKRGLYDRTLFVWLGDHGHYVGEPTRKTPGLRRFYQPNLHTALVMINHQLFGAPKRRPAERVSHRLGDNRDLVPTVLDAMGLPSDPRHEGQSLLATDYKPRRIFFGSDAGQYFGFIDGHEKFVLNTRNKRTEYYDLKRDPEELEDRSARSSELMTRYTRDTLRFAGAARARIAATPTLEERISVNHVYELFIEHAKVSLVREDKRTPCERDDDGEVQCKGLGSMLREHEGVVHGRRRHCVMVRVPEEGRVELRLDYKPMLGLLTGTIVAIPKTAKKGQRPRFVINARSDEHLGQAVQLNPSQAVRPQHPRAKRSLRYEIARTGSWEGGPEELCLQLTP